MDEADLLKYITFNEGYKERRYFDSRGIATVGVGFNLERSGAKAAVESVGADYSRVKSGKDTLSREQITQLLSADAKDATADAKALFPDFESYSPTRQLILVDLVFNLGKSKLSGFTKFRDAVKAGDWAKAGKELQNSRWYKQVGRRAVRNVEAITSDKPPAVIAPKAKDSKDAKEGKDTKEGKEAGEKGKDTSDKGKDNKEGGEKGKDHKEGKDGTDKGKEGKETKDGKEGTDKGKDSKEGKDGKEGTDKGKDSKEGKDGKDGTDKGKDGKDGKDSTDKGKDGKDSTDKGKDGKDGKEQMDYISPLNLLWPFRLGWS